MSAVPGTTPAAEPGGRTPRLFDRLADRLLDRRGDLYGDERERVLWYEGIAVTASVQWGLVTWALAVMAWVAPPLVVAYLGVVWVVFVTPILLVTVYVARARVRLADAPAARSRRWAVVGLFWFWLPVLLFLLAVTVGLDLRTGGLEGPDNLRDGLVGAAIGGTVGLVAASALLALVRHLNRRRRPVGQDDG